MNESRDILQYLHYHPLSSRGDITTGTAFKGSDATLKRMIAAGIKAGDTWQKEKHVLLVIGFLPKPSC